MRDFYRRHLPHYHPQDGIFSVTFRLAGSLPESVVKRLIEEQELAEHLLEGLPDGRQKYARFMESREGYAYQFDEALHTYACGDPWLARREIAELVKEAFLFVDIHRCAVLAHCIMPNHVHALMGQGDWVSSIGLEEEVCAPTVMVPEKEFPLTSALASLKKYTARRANQILHRTGAFWQDETYDHLVRGGEDLERAAWYLLLNPVKAGLCQDWESWPWTYCSPWLRERL